MLEVAHMVKRVYELEQSLGYHEERVQQLTCDLHDCWKHMRGNEDEAVVQMLVLLVLDNAVMLNGSRHVTDIRARVQSRLARPEDKKKRVANAIKALSKAGHVVITDGIMSASNTSIKDGT